MVKPLELQPVRDGEGGDSQGAEVRVKRTLLVRVDRARGLVQHGVRRLVKVQPSQAHALLLTAAQHVRPVVRESIQPIGRGASQLHEIHAGERLDHLVVSRRITGQGIHHLVSQSSAHQVRLLGHVKHLERVVRRARDVRPGDSPGGGFPETRQDPEQRRLARTVGSGDEEVLPGRQSEVYPLDE